MKKRKTVSLVCKTCGRTFIALQKEITRRENIGKKVQYCSKKCSYADNKKFHEAALEYSKSEKNAQHLNGMCRNRLDEYSEFREYIRRAGRRKKLGDITVEYLRELWDSQDGKCSVTGVKLVHGGSNKNYMASLDRMDSSLPYQIGNVRWVSVTVNYAKNDGNEDHLREFIEIIRGALI